MKITITAQKSARALCLLLACALLAAFCAFPVSAAEKTFVLDTERSIEISVLYEGDEPTVTAVSPSGKTLTEGDCAKVERASGILNLYVKNAESGQWTVTATPDADINILAWDEGLTFSSFTAEAVEGKENEIRFSALVTHPDPNNVRFSLYLYALSDFATTGLEDYQVQLQDYYVTANTPYENSFYIRDLPDGNWTVSAVAVYEYPDGSEVETSAVAPAQITVSGHTDAGDPAKIISVVNLTEGTVSFDWSGVEEYYSEMFVSAIGADGEPVFYSEFESNIDSTRIVRKSETENEMTVRFMPIRSGRFSSKYTKAVNFAPDISLSVDTPEATGDMMAKISYSVGDRTLPLVVSVNGKTTACQATGDSFFSVALEQMVNNEIEVLCYFSDSEIYKITKTVTARTDAPLLNLYGATDRMMSKSGTFRISGRTDPDVTLTLNGTEIQINESGEFTAEAPLTAGSNVLTFCAENSFGIKTVRSISVNRVNAGITDAFTDTDGETGFFPLIAASALALLSLVAILTVVIVAKKRRKKLPAIILSAVCTVLALCTVTAGACTAYCFAAERAETHSVEGSSLTEIVTNRDYDTVAAALKSAEIWHVHAMNFLWIAVACLVVLILLLVAIRLISGLLKKQKAKKADKNSGEAEANQRATAENGSTSEPSDPEDSNGDAGQA